MSSQNDSGKRKRSQGIEIEIPEGVAAHGTVANLQLASLQAMVAIPQCLTALVEVMEDISTDLRILSAIAEQWGRTSGILAPDFIKQLEQDDDRAPEHPEHPEHP